MIRRPPRSPLFPSPPLFRSPPVASPAPAAPPMSQRRLSPTKTISERGTGSALTAWSKSLREGLMLEVSDEKTVTTKRSSTRSEEHTSELQSPCNLVCRLLLEKKKRK